MRTEPPSTRFRAEAGVEQRELAHAVEERQQQRVGADRGCDVVHRGLEPVGLGAEQDEVEGLPGSGGDRRRRGFWDGRSAAGRGGRRFGGPRSRIPCARCPRKRKVTSRPAPTSLPPKKPPVAPAPTTSVFMIPLSVSKREQGCDGLRARGDCPHLHPAAAEQFALPLRRRFP